MVSLPGPELVILNRHEKGVAMKTISCLVAGFVLALGLATSRAQDWPQWRGADRQAHVSDFHAPNSWPKELTEKWRVTVGEGVASPVLVKDRLFVFGRQTGAETLHCLAVADGKEI
jgi:outer membrane protein assembly factor BamB